MSLLHTLTHSQPLYYSEPKDLSFLDEDTLANLDVSEVTKRKIRTQRMLMSAKMTALSNHSTSKMLRKSADRILNLSKHNENQDTKQSPRKNMVRKFMSSMTKKKIYPYPLTSPKKELEEEEK